MMTTFLPIARFSTATLPDSDRFDAWHDAVAHLYEVVLPSRAERRLFSGKATSIHLGPLILGRMEVDALAYHRSPAKIRSGSLDHFILGLDDPDPAQPDDPRILIQDLGQPLSLPHAPLRGDCVILPREVMMQIIPGAEALHGTRVAGAVAQLLADHIRSIAAAAPTLEARQAPYLVRAIQQMIAACIAPTPDTLTAARPQLQATLMTRARRYVEQHLSDPDLSSARIGTALGLSRTSLYDLFAPFSGVARYIHGRRLERIHAALVDPGERRRIADIAYDHGLTSEAHFSRAFRKRFGYAPREIRGIGLAGPGQDGKRRTGRGGNSERLAFQTWIEQLSG